MFFFLSLYFFFQIIFHSVTSLRSPHRPRGSPQVRIMYWILNIQNFYILLNRNSYLYFTLHVIIFINYNIILLWYYTIQWRLIWRKSVAQTTPWYGWLGGWVLIDGKQYFLSVGMCNNIISCGSPKMIWAKPIFFLYSRQCYRYNITHLIHSPKCYILYNYNRTL